MWFVTARLIFWILALVVSLFAIRNREKNFQKKLKLIFLTIAIVGYFLSGFILIENYVMTFSSPEAIFHYINTGKPNIILDGQQTTMVVAADNEKSTFVIVPKGDGGWKLNTGIEQKEVLFEILGTMRLTVYRYDGTNDYYIMIYEIGGNPIEVSDKNGSEFIIYSYPEDEIESTIYTYYAYIKNYDGHYELNVNDELIQLDF